MMRNQPWIGKPVIDILFILSPPFLSLLVIALFPGFFRDNKDLPDAAWVILILMIDVAHVYSTLYRTYLDPQALKDQRFLLWIIPFCGFVLGVMLHTMSDTWFWRILAYTAVFHFVRQQYGFMRVYSRKEKGSSLVKRVDTLTIYTATIYPLVYWHLTGPKNFSWFIENDFLFFSSDLLVAIAGIFYFLVLAVYVVKECVLVWREKHFNIPRNLVILGTILSWYVGIVYYNGDLAFTLLNVVSHGVPYMALVWISGKKKYGTGMSGTGILKWVYGKYGIVLFLSLIIFLAFFEEGAWDMFLWKEHKSVFGLSSIPSIELDRSVLNILVPLLALPQITHYIMDGFIWKIRDDGFKWNNEVARPLQEQQRQG